MRVAGFAVIVAVVLACSTTAAATRHTTSIPTSPLQRLEMTTPNQCFPGQPRNDCGHVGTTPGQCAASGCCWSPVNPNPDNEPWCFHPNPPVLGYRVVDSATTDTGFTAQLASIELGGTNPYGKDISPLTMTADFDTNDRLHVKITATNSQRYEVPETLIPRPRPTTRASSPAYKFSFTENPFGFAVVRASSGEVLFNSTPSASNNGVQGLRFADQYLSMGTSLPETASIYGLGESTQNTLRIPSRSSEKSVQFTLWNRDQPSATYNQNLYGSHPFYLDMRKSGLAHGVFLLSSNGMDITAGRGRLQYQAIGGVLDFYFFLGSTPDSVIQQYTGLIGLPHMPPRWALGFHNCRYGYPNIDTVEAVVQNYTKAGIPLDTMWTDIDYMDIYEDFTWDPVNYPQAEVAAFVDNLHTNGRHYVVIVDPGIKTNKTYQPFIEGNEMDIFIKDQTGGNFVGKVWPGLTAFPDFLHPNASMYWEKQVAKFLKGVPLDGLWIDMNEISNFCNGACQSSSIEGGSPLDSPPYAINNCGSHCPLNTKTLDMTAQHYPRNNVLYKEYNVHNMYGFTESIATDKALESITNKRSFVLSRSTFPGSGKYTAHWTGDNSAAWADLQWSVVQVMNFNMYGIPLVGADICGFLGSTTEELCTRWIQVGAFYTFSRNHNTKGAPSQELYRWKSVAKVSVSVLSLRYTLIPYIYSLFAVSHASGSTVLRPLFFNYPTDATTLDIHTQFMIGTGLLITPVLTQGSTSVTGYFPGSEPWYDAFTNAPTSLKGNATLDTPLNKVNVHIAGGNILPRYTYTAPETLRVAAAKGIYFTAASSSSGDATGMLYLDDGESINPDALWTDTRLQQNTFTSTPRAGAQFKPAYGCTGLVVLGVSAAPTSATLNGKTLSSSEWTYDANAKTLSFAFAADLTATITVAWK